MEKVSTYILKLYVCSVWSGLDQTVGFIIQSSPGGFPLDWIGNLQTQRILDCIGSRNDNVLTLCSKSRKMKVKPNKNEYISDAILLQFKLITIGL